MHTESLSKPRDFNKHSQSCLVNLISKDTHLSFLSSSDFCCLLIDFANGLDQDQHQQIVGSDLDLNSLTFRISC